MATPRTTIANAIKVDNATFIVRDYPASPPDNLSAGKVHVSVWRTELNEVKGTSNALEHVLMIEVVVSVTSGVAAENTADDALDDILVSLQRLEGVSWSTAKRTIFDDSYVGYQITASLLSSNVYRTYILEGH